MSSQVPQKGRGTAEADAAIREARAGRLGVREMLRTVMSAQVFVPLAAPPSFDGNTIKSWKPATVSKEPGGAQFLVAFTDISLATTFARSNPSYGYGLLVEAPWLLTVLPPNHGLAFNLGGASSFDWPSLGIAGYQSENP
jgi:hypothetical protein